MKRNVISLYKNYNRIYLIKGINHSYRMIGVKISEINVFFRMVAVKQPVRKLDGKNVILKLNFRVDPQAIITGKNNASLSFSDLKAGNKVIIDFVKISQTEKLIKGIRVLR